MDWDESRLEKHESRALEGLSPVSSSKAARRARRRKGYYHGPVGRIYVPGMQWLAALLVSHYPTEERTSPGGDALVEYAGCQSELPTRRTRQTAGRTAGQLGAAGAAYL